MTTPQFQTTTRQGFRVYPLDGVEYLGVTSVMRNIDKSGLGFARAREAAVCALEDLPQLVRWKTEGKEKAAVDHVRNAAARKWGEAADLGTAVHGLCEKVMRGEELGHVHRDYEPFVKNFEKFLSDFNVKPVEIESTGFNEELQYAGTVDIIANVDGEDDGPIIVDIKTGASGVWPDVALQLSAYANFDFLASPDGTRRDMVNVAGAAALSLRPEGYELIPIRIDDEVFNVFKSLVSVAPWQRTISKQVMGSPVTPEQVRTEK